MSWRSGCAAAMLLLGGCSALQIDVDVYKGPMANDNSMQRDQLVAMAMSARAMLLTVRNSVIEEYFQREVDKEPDSMPSSCPQAARQAAPQASRQLLPQRWRQETLTSPYVETLKLRGDRGTVADADALRRDVRQINAILRSYDELTESDAGRVQPGIDCLANDYAKARDALARLCIAPGGGQSCVEGSGNDGPGQQQHATYQQQRELESKADAAFARLRHAVVDMATRTQFLVNNLWVITPDPHARADADRKQWRLKYKALLETVSNSIVVQADDLRRQDARKSRLNDPQLVESERRAAAMAFAPDTARSADGVLSALAVRERAQRDLESARVAADTHVQAARVAADAARAAREEAADKAAKAELRGRQAGELARTVEPGPAPKAATPGAEAHAALKTDAAAIDKLLQGDGKAESAENLRAQLTRWFASESKAYDSPALADEPRGKRLNAALRFLQTEFPSAGDAAKVLPRRAEAIAEFKAHLGEATRGAATRQAAQDKALAEAKSALETAEKAQTQAQTELLRKRDGGAMNAAALAAALKTLQPMRQGVIAAAQASGQALDYPAAVASFKKLLAAAPAADVTDANRAAALEALDAVARPMALAAPGEAKGMTDVLDDTIAQLRYRYIEALRVLGPQAAETLQLQAALEEARRQREDMIYLRPASSYLRSALTATALQEDPALNWRNMLFANSTRSIRDFGNWLGLVRNQEVSDARVELDKANWQNVNTVRLSGTGLSNFVIAKDDVGNWYVKAMGSDASGMIRTATKLALFNLGGKFDTNLVRVDELRQQMRSGTGAEKEAAAAELKQYEGSATGPAVAARSETLGLFKSNYDTVSRQHRVALANRVMKDELSAEVKARWARTLAGSRQAGTLDSTFTDLDDVVALQAAAKAAIDPEAVPATPAGKAVIGTLQLLQRQRSALKAAVRSNKAFAAEATQAVADLTRSLEGKRTLAAQAALAEGQAGERLLAARRALDDLKDKGAAAADLQRAQEEFDTAGRARSEKVDAKLAADKDVAAELARLEAAATALAATKKAQEAAVADVEAAYKGEIDRFVALRLRVVDETETATKIIGRRQE